MLSNASVLINESVEASPTTPTSLSPTEGRSAFSMWHPAPTTTREIPSSWGGAAHVFGHVHGAYGMEEAGGTLYVNAALLSQDGDIDRKPVVICLSADT